MKLQRLLTIFFIAMICISCKNGNKTSVGHPILEVSFNEKQLSVQELFKEAEIIPLETTDESSFRYIEKVEIYHDTIYVFDGSLNSLYIFGPDGKYIDKIHRVGQGPEEYIMVYDFLINRNDRTIEMLNPMGSIHKYRIDRTFVTRDDLPKPPMNYRNFEWLDKDHYVTWSSLMDGDNGGLNILTSPEYRLSGSYFPNSSLWGAFIRTVFYKYKGSVYYHESMNNRVYRITSNGYEIAYEWYLGVRIVDPKRLAPPLNGINETLKALGEDLEEGKIPFCFARQLQTNNYYYASLRLGSFTQKSLFYEKSTGKSMLFEKTKEGIKVDPVVMTDEYVIGILDYEHKEALRNFVSVDDAALLDQMGKEDNTWLVKFTFK